MQEKKHLLKDYVWHLWNTRKKYWGGEMNKLSHGCTLDCFDCCKFNVYVEEGKIIKIGTSFLSESVTHSGSFYSRIGTQ